MVATLLIGAAVGLNPWLIEHFGMSTFIGDAGPASAEAPVTSGLSPPVSLYELAFCRRDLDEDWARNQLAKYGSSPRRWHGRVAPGSYSEPEIWSRLTRP